MDVGCLVLFQILIAYTGVTLVEGKSSGPPKTRFTIYKGNFTWNEAKVYCRQDSGGHLLRLDSQAKLDLLKKLDKQPPWNDSLSVGQFWIGLHNNENASCSEVHHFWEPGCESKGWADWKVDSPKSCETDRCIVMEELKWRNTKCSEHYDIMCENVLADSCSYTDRGNISLVNIGMDSVTLPMDTNSTTSCETYCNDTAVGDNKGCSLYIEENGECKLNFLRTKTDAFDFQDNKDNKMYQVQQCLDADLKYVLDNVQNDDAMFPETDCAGTLGDNYFEFMEPYRAAILPSIYKTLDLQGDADLCRKSCLKFQMQEKQCWAVNMLSDMSNFCRLYFLNAEPGYNFYTRYTIKVARLLFVRRRIALPPEIPEPMPVENIAELAVDPKNTTMNKLRYISVYEDGPAKMGMGIVGAVFIGAIIFAVIVLDCPVFVKHVRTVGARNIRKRTICRRKQIGKMKNKVEQSPPVESSAEPPPTSAPPDNADLV